MFELRDRRDWQFDEFLVLLAQTIAGYLLAGLIFPDFPLNQTVDLRAHYFSVARDLVLDHALPERANLIFHFVYLAIAALGLATAREWIHKVLALVTASAVVLYISLLFARLR